jgi:hypothetical protein
MKFKKAVLLTHLLASAMLAAVLASCATYQDQVGESRRMISAGNTEQALVKFQELAAKQDGDQLVHLLDYGVALQIAGKLKESTDVLLRADKLADELDYHSVSRVAGSLLTSEEMIQYKGDTFEKIFINAYLAMNYLEMGQLDDALVETRRMNEKYVKLRGEDKKSFELNPFAKYLSAVIWEASGQADDAYIAYKEAYELSPQISTIRQDLIRSSKKARRMDDYKQWKAAFPEIEESPDWYDKSKGELILVYQQGWGPRKTYDRASPRFPALRPTSNITDRAELKIESDGSHKSQFVYDVERAAIATLADDRASLVGRRVGGIVAKEVMADQIRQKNEALGFIAWVFFHVSDRADLRQWSLLPRTIQIVRVPLKPGSYKYDIQGLSYGDSYSGEELTNQNVNIKAGRKVFRVWRSLK